MTGFLDGIGAFLQSFSPEEMAVTRVAFQALLRGRATRVASLASTLNLPEAVVETAIGSLVERGTMARDAETGEIVAARGLSLTRTPHTLMLDGLTVHAFCAVDAVGIPSALHLNARAESRCHLCASPPTITFTEGAVTEAPAGVVIWATERDLTRPLHTVHLTPHQLLLLGRASEELGNQGAASGLDADPRRNCGGRPATLGFHAMNLSAGAVMIDRSASVC